MSNNPQFATSKKESESSIPVISQLDLKEKPIKKNATNKTETSPESKDETKNVAADTGPRIRTRGVPAKTLTIQGYGICFFPEQPRRETVTEQDRATEQDLEKKVQKVETTAVTAKPSQRPVLKYGRLHWRNRLVYLVAFVSFSLSLNNVYHFPMNVFRYGQQFLLPYTLFTIVIGYPLHVLQVSMGQYSQRGVLWVWECAPLASGVGFAMLVACAIVSIYYNIFAAYSLVYFSHCFNSVSPWIHCSKVSLVYDPCVPRVCSNFIKNITAPSKHYFYNIILNTAHKHPPEDAALNSVKWWLILSLFFSWFVIYVGTLRSARSIGKVAIFIVIFSYFAILMLLILVFQLKDSTKGVIMSYSNGSKGLSIFSLEIWTVAAMQVLLELGLCHGIPLVYGSYCHFRNLFYIDSIFLCIINYFNSIIFYFLFFAFIGTLSCDIGAFPWDMTDNSFGIIYIIYSEAFASIRASSLWCMVFFFMLFCIVIGTQIAIAEVMMTALYDNFNNLNQYRWLINIFICLCFFFLGIVFCTANGFYGIVLIDTMPIFFTILLLVLVFAIGLILIYGLEHYFRNMEIMMYKNINYAVRVLLYILLILLVLLTFFSYFIMQPTVVGEETFKGKYLIIAWLIFAIILIPIVLCAIVWVTYCLLEPKNHIFRSPNSWEEVDEERMRKEGPFASDYSSSFTWKWN